MTRPPRRRVLVLRALGLGDLLTATPALAALAGAFPDHERVLAGPAELAPLVLEPGLVHAVLPTRGLAEALPAVERLDAAVNLHGAGPQSTARLAALEPPRLVAFAPPGEAGPAWRADEHETRRWLRLLAESGFPAPLPSAGAGAGAALLALPPPPRERSPAPGATVVHPGAASGARRWPADRFAAVAAAEAAAGRAVVVTGAAGEQALAEEVAAGAGLDRSCVLAGATDIGSLAELVAHAGRVICGDTGVAHLASAVGAPSVVLFGPVSPAVWGPPADGPHRVLWTGRLGDPHAASPSEGLLEISVDQVLAELAALPPPGPGAGRPSPSKLRSRTAPASRSTS